MTDRAVIPLAQPTFGPEEVEAVASVLRSGWVAGQGPQGHELESRFARLCDTRHAVAVNNCTAGLHLALLALGVGPGDDVLVADYTFPATGHAVLYTGATPVFVDVRADTATIDPADIDAAVTPNTRGIIAVDTLGQPADYAELEMLARDRGVFLLEDGACSAGGSYRGRPTGSFGDVACFSLHARKGITSGEGGVVVTDRTDLAEAVRKLSCFGMTSAFSRQQGDELVVPVFDDLGFNYKLSDILAAVAVVQTDRLESSLARRRALAAAYAERLADIEGIVPPAELADRSHTWQTYAVTVAEPLDRGALAGHLRRAGVQSNIGTYASHVQPVYGRTRTCPRSAELLRRHLALPMHANLADGDVEQVVEAVRTGVEAQLSPRSTTTMSDTDRHQAIQRAR